MKTLDFLKCMRKDTPCEWDELDEAIAELEALQQPKSCEGCKWNDIPFPSNQSHCDECKHAYSCYNDNFEPKE